MSSQNGSNTPVVGSTGEYNVIYNESNLDTMARLADNSIDLVMTSPPYAEARKRTYGGICADEYVEWFKPIAKEIYRILKPTGSFILNIGDNTIDGETHLYTFELPVVLKREIGFKFIDPFIWHKKTTPPGRFMNRFKGAWEFCFHFSKDVRIKFNPKAVAQPANEVSIARYLRHKDTHIMKSQSGSGFNNPSKNGRRERNNESGFGTVDERLNMLEEALPSNVLYLSPETMNVGHPAPYPSDLPAFFIKAFTDEGDIVYDPFMGSGTTAEVCLRTGRKFIGSELKSEYCDLSKIRINKHGNTLFK